MSGSTIAAIDIGTNSIHMVIARVGEDQTFEVIDREKEMVRLGSAGGDMKVLEPDAIERGVAALSRFRAIAARHGAQITAVGTSAVREAHNATELLERARTEAGVEVDVISGFEEARLIHLGVLQALPIVGTRHLVVDVGGGSTEIVVATGDDTELARSVKLGAIRLTRRFFETAGSADGRTTSAQVALCRRYIGSVLAPVVRELGAHEIEVAAGSSGSIESVASMVQAERGGDPPRSFNGYRFRRDELGSVLERLVEAGTTEGRRSLPGLDPRRADIALAGALILDEVMERFGLAEMVYSEFALREGVLLDAIERAGGSARHHLHDLRRRSVMHLLSLCEADPDHARHAAGLALAIFDGVCDELGLGQEHRELLEAAALLCNVGLFISHAQHHRHSYYVIRNSEHLLGFTDNEIELIAQVARYHRKSAPRSGHPEFRALRSEDQQVVRKLASILRVALGLDRGGTGRVAGVRIQDGGPALTVEVLPSEPGADLELELYTAGERKAMLEEVLGRPVEITSRGAR